MQNVTNYVPTATITINKTGYANWLANAKARNQHNSVRAKRLALMVQCNGQTVSQFYAACNKKIGQGTVSKKLLAVAFKAGMATFTTSTGKQAIGQANVAQYAGYAATSRTNAKAKS